MQMSLWNMLVSLLVYYLIQQQIKTAADYMQEIDMQIKLHKLLEYKNDNLLFRYQNEYPNSKLTAKESLSELMKYIWLSHKHAADKKQHPENKSLYFKCVMHIEMKDIDNMWHTFLLFTRDYQNFCNDYLNGNFFHHDPLSQKPRKGSKNKYAKELRLYLSYIYENLGEETLIKWFEE
ncbi:MAG: glycine-rich domain-containing protein [Gammaproteobacteria bacterium]